MIRKGIVIIVLSLFLALPMTLNLTSSQSVLSVQAMLIDSSSGKILYVGGDGPDNYTRIQDAVENASEGDTIFVFHGVYYEVVAIPIQLTLLGGEKNTTIIDAEKKGYTVSVSADGVVISNFTIQNGSYTGSMVNTVNLFISSNDNVITRNIFRDAESGIMIYKAVGTTITENTMEENDIGIWLLSSHKNIISRNIVIGNSLMGMDIHGSENTISGNIVTNNSGTGLYIIDATKNIITENEISGNTVGIILTPYDETGEMRDNTISKNNFRNNTKRDASFTEWKGLFQGRNTWSNNYWGSPRDLPKAILGRKAVFSLPVPHGGTLWLFLPWIHFDWHPAQEPYAL